MMYGKQRHNRWGCNIDFGITDVCPDGHSAQNKLLRITE